jgi:hypothetical protein
VVSGQLRPLGPQAGDGHRLFQRLLRGQGLDDLQKRDMLEIMRRMCWGGFDIPRSLRIGRKILW